MKSDLLAIGGIAAVTMAFTLGLLNVDRAGADGPGEGVQPLIPQPTLTLEGCVVTISTDQSSYAPGEKPKLIVEATSTSDQPIEAKLRLAMTSAGLASRSMSRVLFTFSSPLWTHEWTVSIAPGETKRVVFDTNVELPVGQVVSIRLADRNASGSLLVPLGIQQRESEDSPADISDTTL